MLIRNTKVDKSKRFLVPTGTETLPNRPSLATGCEDSLKVAETPTVLDIVAWLECCGSEDRAQVAEVLAKDLDAIRTIARDSAYASGFEEGKTAGEEKWLRAGQALETLAENLAQKSEDDFADLSNVCGEIVAEALSKIAGPILTDDKSVIGSVQQVLSRIREEGEVNICVHRSNLDLLQSQQKNLSKLSGGRHLTIKADPRVELGGCIVESRFGSLDGRIDVQLRQLFESLKAAGVDRADS